MKIKTLFAILYFSLTLNIFSQGTGSYKTKLDSLFQNNFFKTTQIGIDVYDLTSDSSLYKKNEKLLFRPASTLKILTSLAALHFLKNNFTFNTSLFYTGIREDSTINGDLYFVGGFDSEFSTWDLDSISIALRGMGIRKITGNIYGDVSGMDSLYFGKGWMWDDNPEIYSPYLSPLSVNRNGVKFIYHPGEIGYPMVLETRPKSEFFNLTNTSVTIPADFPKNDSSKFEITRDWLNNKNAFYISGDLPVNHRKDSVELNILHPEQYFLTLAKESFIRNGIEVTGYTDTLTLQNDSEKLLTFQRPLDSVLVFMDRISDNLSAELILRLIGKESFGKPGTAAKGIKLVDSLITIASFDPKNYRIADGSGLSFYNLISPELLTGILNYVYKNEKNNFNRLYSALPEAGTEGTLKHRFKNVRPYGIVKAKSGTLSGVSNLAGYLWTRSNHLLSFSVFMNNFVAKSKIAQDFQDKICEILTSIEN